MSNGKTTIVIPTCQKCSGFLNIKINHLNFSIEYACENDKLHKDKNIYFKTFERFYLKEHELKQCSNCQIILENSEFFECDICKKKYCCKCYIKDIQENGHKYKDNNYINNRCPIHFNDLTEYCFNCNKSICIYCMNIEHKNHKVICFHNYLPSDIDIENLKKRIKEKSKFYEQLIQKIDEWNRKVNQKIEELKQNLKDEISLLERIIFNFNNNFRNYTYFKNFEYINNNISNSTNNQYLLEFYNCLSFENQTKKLMTIFEYMGKKSIIKQNKIGYLSNIQAFSSYKFIEKIDENYFIGYDESKKTLYFLYLNNMINSIYNYYIEENIISISKSTLENKIFICLSNKNVKIICYDFEKMAFNLSEIINNLFNNFYNNNYNNNYIYKCIQLSENLYATLDTLDNNIAIWSFKEKIYSKIKDINANCYLQDILLINKDNFMCSSSSNQKLIIYDINKFSVLKVINNIDCRNENSTLLKMNDNLVLINCFKGIGIFDNKTKEIIKYTQEYYSPLNTIITLDNCNKVYISHIKIGQKNINSSGNIFQTNNVNNVSLFGALSNNDNLFRSQTNNDNIIKILVTEINNGDIILCEEYENITFNDTKIKNILCFNNEILIFGDNIYKVSETSNVFNGLVK